MNLGDLRALIAGGESDRVEFKRTTGQRGDAAKTVCAMLNGLGGFVLFGVTEKGEVVGQQLSAHTLEEVANELRRMVELTAEAGLAPPEFECRAGEVLVRFRPTRYVPPTRVGHDLAPLQRELLDVLARIGPASLMELRGCLAAETPDRTVQDNLQMLRRLGLADFIGKGRGARWILKGTGS